MNLLKTYSELRKKINKILNKPKENELLLDINEFEYPRANETYREIHKQLWQEYYNCLRKAYTNIESGKTMHPEALIAMEGTLVTLQCQICISPIETYANNNIEWYFNNNDSNETSTIIEELDNILISPNEKELIIHNIKSEQAGQYWCKLGDMLSTSYYVSIDTNSEEIKIVYPNTAPNKPHAIPKKTIAEYNLNVYTTWTKWSPCSKCNMVGKKVRYGYCTISSNVVTKETKRQITKDEQNEMPEDITQNEVLNEGVNDKIRTILRLFRNKLPCKSKHVPKELLDISDINDRKTEMMVRYCKIKCSQNTIFEVRDKQGNVIESANNSAGIYSMIQGIPVPSPPVIRTTIYQKYDKKAILICPGSLNTNIPITWNVNNKFLNPTVIQDQSQGRIYINPQMHIIFKSLKFEDTNVYSCWQKDKIIGVIKLNVTGEIELQTNYSVIMVGGILIIIVFMMVFWRAFQGRKRFTVH
ncbi:Ig-like V-type domain-containing protein FAM187A [Osmia lignaria lignaria]|uniref:Ig-like V-type domain-containing protein FAM187A n=1 Tax=Osmia lignaria lignaria TaxID=1437193 RepID=UPI00402B70ED